MPRDASGNYTLPAGNPVVGGTTIESNWANSTLDDVSVEMTDSLSRSGQGGMLAPLKHVDGSVSLPAVTFSNNIQSGLYSPSVSNIIMSIAAEPVMRWTAGNAEIWDGAAWQEIVTGSGAVGDFFADGSVAMTGNLRANVADWDIVNEFTGGDLTIGVTDPGGIPRDFIFCDASAGVSLSFGGTYTARTLPHVDGGLQANNTLNGTGWERVLTESDLGELTSVNLNGDLSGGPVLIHKNNETVTITFDSEILPTHSGNAAPQTLAGLVPVGFRPLNNTAGNVYSSSVLGISLIQVFTDGKIGFTYRDWAGAPLQQTSTGVFTITYAIGDPGPPS